MITVTAAAIVVAICFLISNVSCGKVSGPQFFIAYFNKFKLLLMNDKCMIKFCELSRVFYQLYRVLNESLW